MNGSLACRRRWRAVVVLTAFLAVTATLTEFDGYARAATRVPRWRQSPLEVRTTPAVAGLTFEFGGQSFVTDSKGSFVIPTTVLPADVVAPSVGFKLMGDGLRLRSGRTAGGVVYRLERLYRRIQVGTDKQRTLVVLVGLNAYVPVRFGLRDRFGKSIDPGLFESMTVKSSDGAVVELDRRDVYGGAVVFRASRVIRLSGEIVSKPLDYRIQRVLVDGNNVVYRAQQAFTPLQKRLVDVRVLFYSVRVSARDRLFGFGIGSGINLVRPSGAVEYMPFGEGHRLSLRALPRGDYHVSVDNLGLSGSQPLSITRDQVVELKVLSYLDMAVMVAGLLGFAVGLVVIGRSSTRRVVPHADVVATLVAESGPDPSTIAAGPSRDVPRERRRPSRPASGQPLPLPKFPPPRGNR